jgi:RNA polymerase sigma-70 factor (ECF subfamily)
VRSDEDLMAAYAAGDKAAFRELFQRYAPVLMRLMLRDLRRPEDARDLLQQTFLQLHRARFDFVQGEPFRPWLFTIALNLKRQSFRQHRRRPEVPLEPPAEPLAPPLLEQAETGQAVRWALSELSADCREVIELHWLGGLSFAEVGACLKISAVAAKVRAHRGYVRLRELLNQELENE